MLDLLLSYETMARAQFLMFDVNSSVDWQKQLYFVSLWSRINSLMTLFVQPIRRQVDKYPRKFIDESGEYSATVRKKNIKIRLCLKIQQPSLA